MHYKIILTALRGAVCKLVHPEFLESTLRNCLENSRKRLDRTSLVTKGVDRASFDPF